MRVLPDRAYPAVRAALVAVLTVCATFMPAPAQTNRKNLDAAQLFKLKASINTLGKTGVQDSLWRYYSDLGARSYLTKDWAAAERNYHLALNEGEKHCLGDHNKALLLTNLAASLREQNRFAEAELLFKQALRLSAESLVGYGSYAYVLKQYAAMLRKQGRQDEARFAYEAAKSGAHLVAGVQKQDLNGGVGQALPPPLPKQASTAESTFSSNTPFSFPQPRGFTDEPIILDFTLVGINIAPGDQPNTTVYEHSRRYLDGSAACQLRSYLQQLKYGL